MEKKSVLILSSVVFLMLMGVLTSTVPSARAVLTGTVCIQPTGVTGCPTVPTISGAAGTSVTVNVNIAGSDTMGGVSISVLADPTILNPTSLSLTGNAITTSPFISVECINGAPFAGSSCNPAPEDGVGIASVSYSSLGALTVPPTTGLLFSITYQILTTTTGTPISYVHDAADCFGSVAADPTECVLVSAGAATQPELTQGATFSNALAFDYSLSNNGPVSIARGTSGSLMITATLTAGTATPVTLTCSGLPPGITCGAFTVNPVSPTGSTSLPVNVASTVAAGSYSFQVNGSPVGATVSGATTMVSITVPKASPTISSTVTPASISLGGSASDLASLTGGFSPTGTVTYTAYSDSACIKPVFTSAAILLGASSGAFTPTATGTYLWIASYGGDANNNAVASTCGATGETLTVTGKVTPTVTSTVTPSSINIGGSASDLAAITGGSSPTGTVTYNVYSDSACTTLVFTSANIPLGTSSAGFTPTTAGTYFFIASYNGDANNNAAATNCGATGESLTVTKATPIVTTAVSPATITIGGSATDLASVSGGFSPSGTITYTAYINNGIANPCQVLVFTSANVPLGTPSAAFTPTQAIGYNWAASYSGDANNNAVNTACLDPGETLIVSKATPTVTSSVSPASITLGSSASDLATVSGGFNPSGVVTYTAYSDSACSTLVFTSAGIPLGTSSGAFNPSVAGTYLFIASYSGDGNNNAAATLCGAAGETLTVTANATPTITSTVTPSSIAIGGSASDLATVSGGSSPTGTVTYAVYSDSACAVLVFTSASIPLGTSSDSFTPSVAGTYLWIASYSGDANNNAAATACGATGETLTVQAAFDYSLSNNGPVSITAGSSGIVTVTATLTAGTAQAVTLSCVTPLPAGVTCSFATPTVTPTGSSVLTISTSASTPSSFTLMITGSPLGANTAATAVSVTVTAQTGKPVLLTFSGFDLDDFDNGVGQFQVLVNGHLAVDIPAGLNHLSGTGDYAPYANNWVKFGPFDITSFVTQGQNTILFRDPTSVDHFGLVRNVTIVQGSTTLLHVARAGAVFPGHSVTYTFSIPPLILTGFTISPTTPGVDQSVTLTATYTGGTAPFKCVFRFGDGESVVVSGNAGTCSATHDYDYSGTFTVRVTVIGASTSDVQTARLTVNVQGTG